MDKCIETSDVGKTDPGYWVSKAYLQPEFFFSFTIFKFPGSG